MRGVDGAVVFKGLAFAGSVHNYIIMDEDDWLGDQKTAEKKIAEREFLNEAESNYSVGYQGALVGHLEKREEQTALRSIQETVENTKKNWMAKYS